MYERSTPKRAKATVPSPRSFADDAKATLPATPASYTGHDFGTINVSTPPAPLQSESPVSTPVDIHGQRPAVQRQSSLPVQRDGFQLSPPSLLQPPDPAARYQLGGDLQLHLDPQIEAMMQQQLHPNVVLPALAQINLNVAMVGAAPPPPNGTGSAAIAPAPATPASTAVPAATPTPPNTTPEEDKSKPGSAGDVLKAVVALPEVKIAWENLQTLAITHVKNDWSKLKTGEKIGVISTVSVIALGSIAGAATDPAARQFMFDQLNGKTIPVPGLNWLAVETNISGPNLMFGLHLDVGTFMPSVLNFGPASFNALGGPPQPEPLPGQRRAADDPMPSNDTLIGERIRASAGRGAALEPATQQWLEGGLGASLSSVRVHTDSEADHLSGSLGATAFTTGADIFFRSGAYSPSTSDGQRLLAHEATHTVQQAAGPVAGTPTASGVAVSDPSDSYEQAAERTADALVQHDTPKVQRSTQATAAPTSTLVVQRQDKPSDTGSTTVTIDGIAISTMGDAASWYTLHTLKLSDQQKEMQTDNVAVPVSVQSAIDSGKQNSEQVKGQGTAAIDTLTALQIQSWLDYQYTKAMNEAEGEKASVAAKRAKELSDNMQAAANQLDTVVLPQLRDQQRAQFRADNENALMSLADTIATVVDTSLVTKDTILQITAEAAELENMANTAKGYKGLIPSANSKAPMMLECIEKANKVYAGFQLIRDSINALVSGHKTQIGGAAAGVKLMSTAVSAGGTLLGASAGMTLYANLYIGPMVDACLKLIGKITDSLSKGRNRELIQMGQFDTVNWSIEPGGRAVFDFMLQVMRVEDASAIPQPVPKTVADFFVDNDDQMNAGVGGKDELPTTGFWLWKSVDQTKIPRWLFKNRTNVWAMLYGDCPVPA